MAKKTKKSKEEPLNGDEGEAPEAQTSADEGAAQEAEVPARDETPLEQAERERDEYLGNWHRARADYQNLKRRTFDDVQGAVGRERTALLQEMLTILDFLDMALATPVEHAEAKNLKTGVQMTRDQLMALLERHRVAAMETEEGAFDHDLHQAVATVESTDVEPGQIVEVMRRGFTIAGDVLRYAQVRVAAEPQTEAPTEAEPEPDENPEEGGD
ncbi:MAG TPA: nucleotide exchange factor GrpE [Planctomycetota bacterium]|nr:nucleotide exchange factor GrpE [Planctomycetota bacterium]